MSRHLGDDDYTDLTERQEQVLDYIEKCIDSGLPPTRAELSERFGVHLNAIQGQLLTLQRKGRIELLPNTARGIKLVKP